MAKTCKVTLNNEAFLANCGDLLLDSALMNGIDLPHDCRSGICGACRVRLVDGKVFGGQEHGDDMIHACQARVVSDLEIVSEPVPDQVSLPGRVAKLVRLAPDVIGVDVELPKPLHYLPGQYCKLQFRGFPARSYSPTYPLEGRPDPHLLHFHIRRLSDGTVSSALGREIRVGHRVKLTGPLGTRLSAAKSCRQHRSRRQRHRLRADVVDRGRRDHGAAAARTDLRGRGAKAAVAVHAQRAVPAGAVSQRHDHSGRIGAAERLARHPRRTADRAYAEFVGRTMWSTPRARRP